MMHDRPYVARQLGKTDNWVKRNASRLPHHRVGREYKWTDEDIAEILEMTRVRPNGEPKPSGELRPVTGRRRAS